MFEYQKGFANPFDERPETAAEAETRTGEEPMPEPAPQPDIKQPYEPGQPWSQNPPQGPYAPEQPYPQDPAQGQPYAPEQPYPQDPAQGQPYGPEQPYTQAPPYMQWANMPEQPYTQAPPYMRNLYGQPYPQSPPHGQAYASPPPGQPYAPPPDKPYAPQGQPYVTPPGQGYGPSPYSQFAQAQYSGPRQQTPKPERRKEKNRKEGTGLFGIGRRNGTALAAVIIIACVASGVGGGLIGANLNPSQNIVYEGGSPVMIEPSYDITTTEAVARKVLSSVVGIESAGTYSMGSYFFGPSEQEITGVGTGMIIDRNGYILTNSHVVMEGVVDSITVHLSDGEEVEGELIWNDSGLDLAIVKVGATGLEPVELGDSDSVAIGSYVAAIGNPLGLEFSGSITSGVVSGLDRTIQVYDEFTGALMTMQDLIQVDAAINSGNSGGPLLNSRGQVIGINTAKAQAEGMGFAIPINTAIPIVDKVIQEGSFERVFIGVSAADVEVIRENYPKVELFVDKGACITDVNPGSPAEKAGLKVKDVIVEIDGVEITGSNSLIKLLLGYTSGDTIDVTFDRNGETMETEVTLLSQSELEKAQQEENPFKEPERGNQGR